MHISEININNSEFIRIEIERKFWKALITKSIQSMKLSCRDKPTKRMKKQKL